MESRLAATSIVENIKLIVHWAVRVRVPIMFRRCLLHLQPNHEMLVGSFQFATFRSNYQIRGCQTEQVSKCVLLILGSLPVEILLSDSRVALFTSSIRQPICIARMRQIILRYTYLSSKCMKRSVASILLCLKQKF